MEVDVKLAQQWDTEKGGERFSEDEVGRATVLTRLDTALSAGMIGYNAKMLYSIKTGVWCLVALSIINIVLPRL